jgi:hypothetical protein
MKPILPLKKRQASVLSTVHKKKERQTDSPTNQQTNQQSNITAEKRDRPVFSKQSTNGQKERQRDRLTNQPTNKTTKKITL